jgi:hypothetical protein
VGVSSEGSVEVSGFIKGSCINPNQLVHVTGIDDFYIEKIEVLKMGAKSKISISEMDLIQYQTIPEEMNPFSKPEAEGQDEDILAAIKDLQINEE